MACLYTPGEYLAESAVVNSVGAHKVVQVDLRAIGEHSRPVGSFHRLGCVDRFAAVHSPDLPLALAGRNLDPRDLDRVG